MYDHYIQSSNELLNEERLTAFINLPGVNPESRLNKYILLITQ